MLGHLDPRVVQARIPLQIRERPAAARRCVAPIRRIVRVHARVRLQRPAGPSRAPGRRRAADLRQRRSRNCRTATLKTSNMAAMRSRPSNTRLHSAGGAARIRNRRVGSERLRHR
eukprot:3623387-Pleurochrysis_carterae.AAC.1